MIVGSKIKLRKKRLGDAADDYSWQTDPELAQLDAAPVLTIPFPQYLSDYASELRYPPPARHRFAIETPSGKHIGNCTYYGINATKGEAELGIIIGNRDYWNKGYGADAITTLVSYIFHHTNFKRIYLKTLNTNTRAQKCFKKCGFTPYGRRNKDGYDFLLMEINRKQWQEQQAVT
ncbi:MAG: GNAT family N-acetyltransferase [Dehalococcoidia bacterium]|nr:GNAT family N-acetyltransferase [Dehalococcoidia bacterium]